MRDMVWDAETRTLRLCSDLLAGEPYRVYLYVPDGFTPAEGEKKAENVYCFEYVPETDGEQELKITF